MFDTCVMVMTACAKLKAMGVKSEEVTCLEAHEYGVLFFGVDGRRWFYDAEIGVIL